MTQYSHSRLSTFEQCRLKYKYQYIDKIRGEGTSIEAFMGSRFHEVMEKTYKERDFRTPTPDELKNYFNELWEKNWSENVFVTRKDRTAEDYRNIGLTAIENYYKRYAPFRDGRVLGIETKINAELDEPGHQVMGYIDRLMEMEDGFFEIHDYKTSAHVPEQSKLDHDRQLALYEIAVREMWPNDVKKVDLVWHYVCFDKEMRSRRSGEALEELKESTISLIDEIESAREYPPHETNLCEWCDFCDICPLFAHEIKTSQLPPNKYLKDDGVKLVNTLADLDNRKKELKAELNAIDEEEDAVKEAAIALAQREGVMRFVGSDRQLTIKEEVEISYPDSRADEREEFEAALKELGIWEQVSGFVASTFRAMARRQWWKEGVPTKVAAFVQLKPCKKVHLSRRKDEEPVM